MIISPMAVRNVTVFFMTLNAFSVCCAHTNASIFRRESVELNCVLVKKKVTDKVTCLAVCGRSAWCSGGVYYQVSNICKLYQGCINPGGGEEKIYIKVLDQSSGSANVNCGSLPAALGIGDPDIISDSAFLASSNYSSDWDASHGRICEACNAWCTPLGRIAKNGEEWWQVNLGRIYVIQQIAIQGVAYSLRKYSVQRFSLGYSNDGMEWNTFLINGVKKVFDGNVNAASVVSVALPVAIKSRYLRVWIESYKCINFIGKICARFELYGCKV